jgi:hypothetical protein
MNHADIELKRALSNILEQSALFVWKRHKAKGARPRTL